MTMVEWTPAVSQTFRTVLASNMSQICGENSDRPCTADDFIILNVTSGGQSVRRVLQDSLRVTYAITVRSPVAGETVIEIDKIIFSTAFVEQLITAGLQIVDIRVIKSAVATVTTAVVDTTDVESDTDKLIMMAIMVLIPLLFCSCCALWYLYRHSIGKSSVPSAFREYASKYKGEFRASENLTERIPDKLSPACLVFGSMRSHISPILLMNTKPWCLL